MTLILPSDEELVDDMCEMVDEGYAYQEHMVHGLSYTARCAKVAEYREKVEQAARDETARAAFAAGCQRCSVGHRAILTGSNHDPEWTHETDEDGLELCNSNRHRLVLDPEGRLAGGKA